MTSKLKDSNMGKAKKAKQAVISIKKKEQDYIEDIKVKQKIRDSERINHIK